MSKLPLQRTLEVLRKQGFMVDKVEHWNSFARKRVDLFHIFDILAVSPNIGFLGIQCGSGSGHSAHRAKIVEENRENTENWLRSGGKIQIWSWRKLKVKRGGKAMRWSPKIEDITLDTL